jgi:secreted PhoX family phosphatase
MSKISRRSFLAASAVSPFAAPFAAFARRRERSNRSAWADDYGPLRPAEDRATGLPLLELPEGFWYVSFGWTGDLLGSGELIPGSHDGMGAFAGPDDTVFLVRNHERSPGEPFASDPFDTNSGGGTITMRFDPRAARVIDTFASLTGTLRNCAGGRTPWNSWLSCEETVLGPPGNGLHRQHGYVFEVPCDGVSAREPLIDMGCFVHEAAAVDPDTGMIYETEDQEGAGVYRFIPNEREQLSRGGRLQMLAIDGRPGYDARGPHTPGERLPCHWVDIPEPNRPHADLAVSDGRGVQRQGFERGAAMFARLEGAYFGDGVLHVIATNGGAAQMGQVWEVDDRRQTLRLVYESPGADVLNMPDNVCLSPRGALVLCEDGTSRPSIHGLTRDGRIFRFARNNIVLNGERHGIVGDFRGSEFCGATFSPDGNWLFVNAQEPGITFAITGPWELGAL